MSIEEFAKEIERMDDRYLFKAKRIDNGEWVQGSLVYDNRDEMYRIIIDIHYSTGTCLTTDNAPKVDASTICQCTGLKDKNGKLIWENDVVKKHFYSIYDDCVNSEEYIGVVKLKDFAWVVDSFKGEYKCAIPIFEVMSYSEDVKHFEVIGNIFDNKELLEREE